MGAAITTEKHLVRSPGILSMGIPEAEFDSVSARLACEMRERMEVHIFRTMGIPPGILDHTDRPSHFPLIMPPPTIEVYRPEPFRFGFDLWQHVVVQLLLGPLFVTACESDDPGIKRLYGVKFNNPSEWRKIQIEARRLGATRRFVKWATKERAKRAWNKKRRNR